MELQQTFKALLGFLRKSSVYVIKDELTTYTLRRKLHKMYTIFCQKKVRSFLRSGSDQAKKSDGPNQILIHNIGHYNVHRLNMELDLQRLFGLHIT
jgi:hypothetical protein